LKDPDDKHQQSNRLHPWSADAMASGKRPETWQISATHHVFFFDLCVINRFFSKDMVPQ
jgi:hypothetical protein